MTFEVQIDKLVYGGCGLGRTDGRVVLTPFVLPGETVTLTLVESPLIDTHPVMTAVADAFGLDGPSRSLRERVGLDDEGVEDHGRLVSS